MLSTRFLYKWGQRSRSQWPKSSTLQSPTFWCIHKKIEIVATKNVKDKLGIWFFMFWGQRLRSQWPRTVCNIPLSQHVSPIWDFYVIKRYAPHTILKDQSQRSRSQRPKNSTLQSTTPKCIPTRNLLRYARDTIILVWLSQEVKVKVTPKMVHNTLHPKMHPHTDFGIPTFNSNWGMLQTRCEVSDT